MKEKDPKKSSIKNLFTKARSFQQNFVSFLSAKLKYQYSNAGGLIVRTKTSKHAKDDKHACKIFIEKKPEFLSHSANCAIFKDDLFKIVQNSRKNHLQI